METSTVKPEVAAHIRGIKEVHVLKIQNASGRNTLGAIIETKEGSALAITVGEGEKGFVFEGGKAFVGKALQSFINDFRDNNRREVLVLPEPPKKPVV